MKKKITTVFSLILIVSVLANCKKLVEVDGPSTSLNSANIYETNATAASVVTGIYTSLSSNPIYTGDLTSMSFLAGLSSDELVLYNPAANRDLNFYYTNTLNSQSGAHVFWDNIYTDLYIINAAFEGITNSTKLSPSVKQQLLGEVRFMRAFCFFYLVNLYGDVPLVLSTDYKVNSLIPRTPKEQVWQQIILDLKEAQELLNPNYLDATLLKVTGEKVRPTKWAATALLARAYLYTNKFVDAEIQATAILEASPFELVSLDQVFLKNNKEAIWQLQPVNKGWNSQEAISFAIDPIYGFSSESVYLNQALVTSFDNGDERKNVWTNTISVEGVTYWYPTKYRSVNRLNDPDFPVDEYSTIFRLAEQYLIRAEAYIRQGKIPNGISDLNILRHRATSQTSGSTQLKQLSPTMGSLDALKAVEHERQVELFTEWGHRWLDLKRTNRIDEVMKEVLPKKVAGGVWRSFQQWYPLPQKDLQRNPSLVQNAGY